MAVSRVFFAFCTSFSLPWVLILIIEIDGYPWSQDLLLIALCLRSVVVEMTVGASIQTARGTGWQAVFGRVLKETANKIG